ncbi:hypothetical protein ACET3Z_020720 [Daucus carota]
MTEKHDIIGKDQVRDGSFLSFAVKFQEGRLSFNINTGCKASPPLPAQTNTEHWSVHGLMGILTHFSWICKFRML